MTDYYLPPTAQGMEWELRSNVARFSSPMGGVTRTAERVGSRWAATFRWDVLVDREAAQIKQFLASQRGGANRFWCYDPSYSQRGSFSASELFTATTNSTTGWTSAGGLASLDGSLRITVTNPAASSSFSQSLALAQYAPHALRSVLVDGQQSSGLSVGRAISDGTLSANDYATSRGLGTLQMIASAAVSAAQYPLVTNSGTGFIAGSYLTVPYLSLARCALVDNGTNMLLRSDEFDNASWTKVQATITADSVSAPDGTTTADALTESVTSGVDHYVTQTVTVPSAAADYAFAIAIKANNRNFARIQIQETTGSGVLDQYFNVNGVAVGTTGATGSNWANRRAFVRDMGGGWVMCVLVGRKTNAATSLQIYVKSASSDGVSATTGNVLAMYMWRATLAASGVPTRLVQTTSTATTGTSQTGAAIYLKGLPASTDGLLYAGDWVEFITPTYSELKRVTAPLNSDAAGLGYLQFEPTLRQSPADNAAVIIRKPMVRMLLDESTVKMQHQPGGISSCSFTAVEDVAA